MIFLIAAVIMFVSWVVFAEFVLEHTRHIKEHNLLVQALIYIISFIFVILIDIPFNIVFGTLYFRQKPGVYGWSWSGWTLTERLRHMLKTEPIEGWRWGHAYFICRKLISPWDFNHCGLGLGRA